ncbi:MAG: hypothetical protein NVSMB68_04640 [Thermoanaerobaculia bacterium]
MRRVAFLPLALLISFCAGGRGASNTSVPGHGALNIQISPNPVVATKVSGSTYDFPFDVVLRETGGHPVEVDRVSANVVALGGIQVASETYDAARIRSLGFSTHVPPNGELRFHFDQRRDVTNDLLFQGVSAEIRVDGHDETGTPTTAVTRVSVVRG